MSRIGVFLAGFLLVLSGLAGGSAAMADFSISKGKQPPKAQPTSRPRPPRPNRPPRTSGDADTPPEPVVEVLTGIDPALMQQAVTEAKYNATLARDAANRSAVLQVTDSRGGWAVNFTNCKTENHCGTMEFYTLWRTPNEANVCTIWGRDITKDLTRTQGRPFCYTVPGLDRQFHLKLSSEQSPYAEMPRLAPDQAKERMQAMISTWSTYLSQLNNAYKLAQSKCPRATDRCA